MSSQDHHHIVRSLESITDVSAANWDRCANPDSSTYNPFVSYDFLSALEQSHSACPDEGWTPYHITLYNETVPETLLGVMPCYLKTHSYGEYVFDHAWADLYMRLGRAYYPKLQCSIPFTPATGPRLLVPPGPQHTSYKRLLALGAAQIVEKLGVSSFHCTFLGEDDYKVMDELQFLSRTGQQFHWHNQGYHTFDDFLDSLSSRKRKTIRKERREAIANDIEIDWVTGSDLKEAHWDHFYRFYMDTTSRKWGQAYLTRDFFSLIGETMKDQILLILCRRAGNIIAGALNFIGGDTLFGRNWGAIEDHRFLHFEACYYQAIDFAIQNRLSRVEAGAQGQHKLARGYLPTSTYSTHYIADPDLRKVIARHLEHEKDYIALENDVLRKYSPYAKTSNQAPGSHLSQTQHQIEGCDKND